MENKKARKVGIICAFLVIEVIFAAVFEKRAFDKVLSKIYRGKISDAENFITQILQNTKKQEYKDRALFLRAYASYSRYMYDDAEKVCDEVLSRALDRYCFWLKLRIKIDKGLIEQAREFLKKVEAKNNELGIVRQLFTALLDFEAYEFEKFIVSGLEVYKKFIEEKEYKKLNVFELEDLAMVLFHLYERSGQTRYLNYVMRFEDNDENTFPESKAKDVLEYMVKKKRDNINAYVICSYIALEFEQRDIVGECVRSIRKINAWHPYIGFLGIMQNFRAMLIQAPQQLIGSLIQFTTEYPNFYPAYLLLAMAYSQIRDYSKAEEYIYKTLKLHKNDISALGLLYNIAKTKGNFEKAKEVLNEIAKNRYRYANFLYEIGVQVEAVARWPEAHKYFSRAYRLDKNNRAILKVYATNLSRMRKSNVAYRLLKKYFRVNPFDRGVANVLKLLEKVKKEFITVKTKNFVIKLHRRMDEVYDDTLMPFYLGEVAERALVTLSNRYGINLPVPVHLELLTDSEDLAVRTFGFPLLGVLGSCFGSFLTTLSPKARFDLPTAAFNWAAVFWHELAHSFHLYLSDFKVPRWFTEGLATYEESLADSRWNDTNYLAVFYTRDRLPTLEDLILDRAQVTGFGRLVFYDYGSIIMRYLHKTYGFTKIIEMLKLWKKNLSSREVFELALNKTVKEISDDFAKFFDEFFKNIKVPPPPPQDPANRQLLEQEDQLPKMNLTPQQLDFLASYAAAFLNSDKKRAQKLAKIVLLKNENHPLANFVMGWVYKYLNLDNNSAKQKFLTAINNGLDTSGVYRELGKILFEESNYVEAEGYLLKAIEKMPYYLQPYIDENPYLMLGKMYEETNQYEKAKEIYDKYLQLGAKDFDVIVKIADAFFEKNDFVNALDYYKLAAYIKLDNPLLHFNIARTYIKLKEYDNALSVLDILEKFTLLEIERTKNKKEKAAKKEAVAKIYCTKAKIYKTKGAQTEAENLATKADKVDKDIKCLQSIK